MGHWFGAVPRGSMFREVRGARERRAGGDDEVAREEAASGRPSEPSSNTTAVKALD